jgi:hypothetical protein
MIMCFFVFEFDYIVDAHRQLLDGSQVPPMEELEKVPQERKGTATL